MYFIKSGEEHRAAALVRARPEQGRCFLCGEPRGAGVGGEPAHPRVFDAVEVDEQLREADGRTS